MIREVVVAAALVVAATLGGCTIQDRYEADPASVGDEALGETGYEPAAEEELVRNVTDAGGSGRNITVVSHLRSYTREVQVGDRDPRELAGVVVVASPSITVYGSEQNPVAEQSERELLDRFRGRLSGAVEVRNVRNVSRVGVRNVTVLDDDATVVQFRATATVAGRDVRMTVEVAKVQHDGDYLVLAAAYPTRLADRERPRVTQLFEGVAHE